MAYRTLNACITDLERTGQLVRINEPIDPNLEAAEIQRRVFAAGGPAILFANVQGCKFPMVSNLFGTMDRARFIFRDSLDRVRKLIELKIDPKAALKHPLRYASTPLAALSTLPKSVSTGPVLENETTISQLPQMVSWPDDGGAFITLPQVYTEMPGNAGLSNSNLGMYRVQLSGGSYTPNEQIGLHYQLHRSIGVHHAAANQLGEPLRVNVFIGGPPAMSVAAVMPLPEGMSELTFAGALGGRRVRMIRQPNGLPIHADTDFCITGTVEMNSMLPEGPFGDHLGYYSKQHDFPVLRVEKVFHRTGAIWPFTVVGRPPQEDTIFGQLIHEITGPIIPTVLPGVQQVHAVDAAGVHPLLLAIGSERYMPFMQETRPQELLTQANAILGQGQLSLAKFLIIVNQFDNRELRADDEQTFIQHLLERADWKRDLHFQTQTTIDTLDYSGSGLNAGSKVVMAAVGPKQFDLPTELPSDLRLPEGFTKPRLVMPGVLAIQGPPCPAPKLTVDGISSDSSVHATMKKFCNHFTPNDSINAFRWIVIVDDSQFVSESTGNFLWATFTRTNPAADLNGIGAFTEDKHWGCRGALVFDARVKPHHAPPLIEDANVSRKIDALATKGNPLHGLF